MLSLPFSKPRLRLSSPSASRLPSYIIPFLTALGAWLLCTNVCNIKVQHILTATPLSAHGTPISTSMKHSDAPTCAPFSLSNSNFSIEGDTGAFFAKWTTHSPNPDVLLVHLTFTSEAPARPSPLSLVWTVPSLGIDGVWTPKISMDKSTYWGHTVEARSTTFAPVLSLRTAADRNRITFAVADALNSTQLSAHVLEEDVVFRLKVMFFSEPLPAMTSYATQIRIDLRDVTLPNALRDVSAWWAQQPGYTPASVPSSALAPVYSTWYNFHQKLNVSEILAELDIAKDLGYGTVIVDDGWQTRDSARTYAYTGDWQPDRIPEMRAFVNAVHAKGMNFMLWYSVPFMGERASRRKEFENKFLKKSVELSTYVLDPRYPEVREYLISTYETALRDWDLDGFKLDFIDDFVAKPDTPLTQGNGRDFASVNAAVDRLMSDVIARLRVIKPNILIEFRQRYIGPLMRSYGNMFRACDCPNNADVNRARIVDLRLLSGETAVHSDMLLWHPEESVEHAALQMLSALFAVPQVSVLLKRIPASHLQMLRFWTEYWITNRDVLMHGDFHPSDATAAYPVITAKDSSKSIIAVYADRVVELEAESAVDIVNAKAKARVIVRMAYDFGETQVEVFDTRGNLIESTRDVLGKGVHEIGVPPSGLLTLRRL